ncbi:transglutaminase-like domain-containing protein [Carboxylicivirga sp. RSCT41]|uniref:transglutaminase-like domain-containing protein n=1 Tax=Carboxylicivirga agarovorans TaxID=3417570 RepID=UPI003D331D3E
MRYLLLIILMAYSAAIFSQGYIENKLLLQKRWPEATAVITDYKVIVDFEIDPTTGMPIAKQKEIIKIVPTGPGTIERMYFYHDHSKVNNASCRINGKRRQSMNELRGDWEIDGIFHSDQKFAHYDIPTYKEGGHYRFEIEKQYTDIRYLTRLYFGDMLYPVENYSAVINVPKWLNMDIATFNFQYFDVSQSEETNKDSKSLIYTAKNIDVQKKDDSYLSAAHSDAHILFLPKVYETDKPNNILNDIHSLYTFYQGLVGNLEVDTTKVHSALDEALKDAVTQKDTIAQIYYWVQDNIRYLAFEEGIAGFRPEKADLVLDNKYGDCKGMANLLKTMLVLAGFDARLAWVGTHHLTYDYSYPSLAVDNHMICYLSFNDQDIFLDATQKNMELGRYSHHLQGRQVMIEDGKQYSLKHIPWGKASDNLIESEAQFFVDHSKIKGRYHLTFYGESAYGIKNLLRSIKLSEREERVKTILKQDNRCVIDSLKMDDVNTRDNEWHLSCYLEINDKITVFGDDMYINLNILLEPDKLENDTLGRNHLYLGCQYGIDSKVSVKLPESMTLSYNPELPDIESDKYKLSAAYSLVDNELIYKKRMLIESSIIKKEDFDPYMAFVKSCKKVLDSSVELKQSNP